MRLRNVESNQISIPVKDSLPGGNPATCLLFVRQERVKPDQQQLLHHWLPKVFARPPEKIILMDQPSMDWGLDLNTTGAAVPFVAGTFPEHTQLPPG